MVKIEFDSSRYKWTELNTNTITIEPITKTSHSVRYRGLSRFRLVSGFRIQWCHDSGFKGGLGKIEADIAGSYLNTDKVFQNHFVTRNLVNVRYVQLFNLLQLVSAKWRGRNHMESTSLFSWVQRRSNRSASCGRVLSKLGRYVMCNVLTLTPVSLVLELLKNYLERKCCFVRKDLVVAW